jgi:phosphinothricin acetyltransferase
VADANEAVVRWHAHKYGGAMPTRAATVDDLDAIAEIYGHYVATSVATFEMDPPDAVEWRRRFAAITDARLPFLVTERDGVVAGYAYCGPWKSRPAYRATVENSVYVAPSAIGKGCGTELMRGLLDACVAAGIREVVAVIADTGDPASVELHRRCGFIEAGRLTRVGFKHGRYVDTLLLQRTLA